MDMHIEQLPFIERKQLCALLNANQSWMQLASAMQIHLECELNAISQCASPSDKLLEIWGGRYGHNVMELFTVLYQCKNYPCMNVLRPFVDRKYHKLIKSLPNTNPVASSPSTKKPELNVGGVVASAGSIPSVEYKDLETCTQQWSAHCMLGRGGYATVFKAVWKRTVVAVKRIEAKRDNAAAHEEQMRQSIAELKYLNAYRHENILPIYAYSIDGAFPCLVYQFMSGGALDKRLHTNDAGRVLSWQARLDIVTGAARGVQYLHTLSDTPLIHVDIKPANILLDGNDVPKIGDFGLARLGPNPLVDEDVQVSRTFGTLPYLPYEFLASKRLTTKIDVYSFGVVLFEVATGLPVLAENRAHRLLRDHVTKHTGPMMALKDQRVAGGERIFVFLLTYGKACVDPVPANRPEMDVLLEELEKIPRNV